MDQDAYRLYLPDRRDTAVVFSSPHSGQDYPHAFLDASLLDAHTIRSSEDAFVDRLFAHAPQVGAPLIAARAPRAYIDLNREPWELDPAMFEDELPDFARARTARVAAGLGTIARVAGGKESYRRKLTFAEARARIETVHQPYHDALTRLLSQARAAHGVALLVDEHEHLLEPFQFGHGTTALLVREIERAPQVAHRRAQRVALGDEAETTAQC